MSTITDNQPAPGDTVITAETAGKLPAAPKSQAPDPFDPAKLRLSQNLTSALGVKKHLTTIPTRKPSKEWFVRCHADPAYRLETYVVDLREDSETYLVESHSVAW